VEGEEVTVRTLDDAIAVLNELVTADRDAMDALVERRVACNEKLVAHPTAQVRQTGDQNLIGLLGVLNAIFGVDDEYGSGVIAGFYDEDDGYKLTHFGKTPKPDKLTPEAVEEKETE
jgi:hypothetical protein